MHGAQIKEEWRAVHGHEGVYQVSNLGNVRSIGRFVNTPVPKTTVIYKRFRPGVALIPTMNKRTGYMVVTLYKDGKPQKHTVHRLVAEAFIENPDKKKCVNHKDYNRTNNNIANLEWVTHSENALWSREAMSKAHIKKVVIMNDEKHFAT